MPGDRDRRRRWVNRFGKAFILLQRIGITTGRAHILRTVGRRTGQPRDNPVGVVPMDGQRYIFQAYPRAAWVANVRAHPIATLLSGRHSADVTLIEVPAEERRHLLRHQIITEPQRTGQLLVRSGLTDRPDPKSVAAAAERIAVFRIAEINTSFS